MSSDILGHYEQVFRIGQSRGVHPATRALGLYPFLKLSHRGKHYRRLKPEVRFDFSGFDLEDRATAAPRSYRPGRRDLVIGIDKPYISAIASEPQTLILVTSPRPDMMPSAYKNP